MGYKASTGESIAAMIDHSSGLEPSAFGVELRRSDVGVVQLRLTEELGIATAPVLRAEIERAFTAGTSRLVLDLRDLEFMDSTGIAECCRATEIARVNTVEIELVRGRPSVHRVFEIAGLAERLPFVSTSQAMVEPTF